MTRQLQPPDLNGVGAVRDELVFENGLVDVHDASTEVAKLRIRMQDELKSNSGATRAQVDGWVAGCFSRDYGRKACDN